VKLTTYIGKPIFCKPYQTASDLANETKKALQLMIRHHQNPNSNIFKGIRQRFQNPKMSVNHPTTEDSSLNSKYPEDEEKISDKSS